MQALNSIDTLFHLSSQWLFFQFIFHRSILYKDLVLKRYPYLLQNQHFLLQQTFLQDTLAENKGLFQLIQIVCLYIECKHPLDELYLLVLHKDQCQQEHVLQYHLFHHRHQILQVSSFGCSQKAQISAFSSISLIFLPLQQFQSFICSVPTKSGHKDPFCQLIRYFWQAWLI